MTFATKSAFAALAGAALASLAAAPALAGDPASRSACFRLSDMEDHTVAGPSTLYVKVRPRQYYRFEMSGSCLAGATSTDALVVEPTTGSGLICSAIDLDLKVHVGGMLSPCIIKKIVKMSPAEVAAIPRKLKP